MTSPAQRVSLETAQTAADAGEDGVGRTEIERMWERVRTRLRVELGEDVFTSWFARVEPVSHDGATMRMSVPTPFLKSWISSHYRDKLVALWQAEDKRLVRVDIAVRRPEANIAPRAAKPSQAKPAASTGATSSIARFQPATTDSDNAIGSVLDPHMTFDTFVVGQANGLAHAAAKRIASSPLGAGAGFNILFVHSAVGLGKTHLLQAMAHEARRSRRPGKVLYLTAEGFVYRFVKSFKLQDTLALKQELRGVELMLIDDMQFLQGKATQQELCHTLNVLIESGRQVVVAADRAPGELDNLDERMRSRLSAGLVVDIQPLGRALRFDMLRAKLATACQRFPTLSIGDDVLAYLADNIAGNGRELEGAFTKLVAQNVLAQSEVTLATAEQAIRDLVRNCEPRRVRIEQIQRIVSKHFNVSRQDLVSNRRNRSIVWPRQICMYLAKTMTDRSFPEIGRRFGGRDHTTVLHAVRKIEGCIGADQAIADEVDMLRRLVAE